MRILSEIDFALSNSKCQCKDALLIVSEWSVVSKNSEFFPGWGGLKFIIFAELSESGMSSLFGILSKQNRTTMNVPASLVETIDVGTAVTSMIVRTAVLTKIVGTAVLTKVVGTANKELFVIAIIIGIVVSTIIVGIPVPPMIV